LAAHRWRLLNIHETHRSPVLTWQVQSAATEVG